MPTYSLSNSSIEIDSFLMRLNNDLQPLTFISRQTGTLMHRRASMGASEYDTDTSLLVVSLGKNLTGIGDYAFQNCPNIKGQLTIPKLVTSVGAYAFQGCSGLSSISSFPTTAPTLGTNAFDGVGTTGVHVPVGALGYGSTWGGLTVIYDL